MMYNQLNNSQLTVVHTVRWGIIFGGLTVRTLEDYCTHFGDSVHILGGFSIVYISCMRFLCYYLQIPVITILSTYVRYEYLTSRCVTDV